jgi:Rha family phage regulatory protein
MRCARGSRTDMRVAMQKGSALPFSSLEVAARFEKQHNKVLRDIRELECSPDFRVSNFGQSSYTNAQGKTQPCDRMTRDGFMFLVMGFTGRGDRIPLDPESRCAFSGSSRWPTTVFPAMLEPEFQSEAIPRHAGRRLQSPLHTAGSVTNMPAGPANAALGQQARKQAQEIRQGTRTDRGDVKNAGSEHPAIGRKLESGGNIQSYTLRRLARTRPDLLVCLAIPFADAIVLGQREIGVTSGKAGPGRGHKKTGVNHTRLVRGTGNRDYTIARLRRDAPELAERVMAVP